MNFDFLTKVSNNLENDVLIETIKIRNSKTNCLDPFIDQF